MTRGHQLSIRVMCSNCATSSADDDCFPELVQPMTISPPSTRKNAIRQLQYFMMHHTITAWLKGSHSGGCGYHSQHVNPKAGSAQEVQIEIANLLAFRPRHGNLFLSLAKFFCPELHRLPPQVTFTALAGWAFGHNAPLGPQESLRPRSTLHTLPTEPQREAGPVESLGVSVRVRTRGRKIQGITTSFDHASSR